MLRGDLERCLIVAPGGLVEQWQDELREKFGMSFELLTRQLAEAEPDGSVFARHHLLIARMDQLSRSEDLKEQLEKADWDLVVVDEAHRMSAHYFGSELKKTKRYQLGELLGRHARHLLLMTATPHAGREEDFQLFMALLDTDRFEGRYRDAVHAVDTDGLMRRMVKEDLKTFEGKPLFPERLAYTVTYELSPGEKDLYDAVTQYVREEMNRADRLKQEGDNKRGFTVGFALTVLQRRLASSPEAILKSLERRRKRLEKRRNEMRYGDPAATDNDLARRLSEMLGRDLTDEDEIDDVPSSEAEEIESEVADAATAARTIAELDKELAILADLVEVARRVRHSGTDKKWTELRDLLTDNTLITGEKIIIFTEHRDTLEYLTGRIRDLLGRPEAVVTIHGGVRREERRKIMELFAQDVDTRVLVATDAAGEGLNLQRAHLMVNYDLPWNPNRIEQRFGRIHRIGQTEVCHLWNLVAGDTREGMVFAQLLGKIDEQRKAYHGVRGWYRPRTAEIPQASVVQRRDWIVRPWILPMTFEELAQRGFRLAPFRHPRQTPVRPADRPQQSQRLVERLTAIRRPVRAQRGEQLDQAPYRQARCRLRHRHLEAETIQQASDGRRPAAEAGSGKRFLAGNEAMCRAHDRLRIIGLAVNHQPVRASRTEPVLLEEPVLAKPVILRHGSENLEAG